MRRALAMCLVGLMLALPQQANAACISSTTGYGGSCSASSTGTTGSTSTEGWGIAGVVVGGLAVAGLVFAIIWVATRPAMGTPPTVESVSRDFGLTPVPPPGEQPPGMIPAPMPAPSPGQNKLTPPPPPPPTPPPSVMRTEDWELLQLRSYDWVKPHARQLRADLAAGAGPTIDDLAAMAGIRQVHLSRFGRVLRAQRGELLAVLEADTLTPDATARLMLAVGRIGWSDPVIAAEAGRALASRSELR